MNETTTKTWQIWKIYRFLRYLFVMLGAGGVAYFVLLNIFYRGKAMDSAFETFLFFWTFIVVPTGIAYAIVEKKYRRKIGPI
jgi:hypothetical protein